MNKRYVKEFHGTPFVIETEEVDNGPEYIISTKISIYRDDILVGQYIRNHDLFPNTTFYPFRVGDQWYALYSADCSISQILKINIDSIEHWCDIDNDSPFYPVEFYVPKYHRFSINDTEFYVSDSNFANDVLFQDEIKKDGYIDTSYHLFGFLSGTEPDDEFSWKLRYIDLSKISDKIVSISERFGYKLLPPSFTLRQCVDLHNWSPIAQIIAVSSCDYYDLGE